MLPNLLERDPHADSDFRVKALTVFLQVLQDFLHDITPVKVKPETVNRFVRAMLWRNLGFHR